jgi:acyl-CoA reductase-like NAD-dependent aldehyde dehydrogenase
MTTQRKITPVQPRGKLINAGQTCIAPDYVLVPRGDVDDDMRVMREEIFGPVLPIVPYDTLADALNYVNQRDRPLA